MIRSAVGFGIELGQREESACGKACLEAVVAVEGRELRERYWESPRIERFVDVHICKA